jgi:tyramine---L-glutamate ligase
MTWTAERVGMRRIFVYEYLSGGGCVSPDDAAFELLPAGVAMRNAIVGDLLDLPALSLTCAVSGLPGAGIPPQPADGRLRAATPRAGEAAVAFVQRMAREHDACWIVAPETEGVLARLHEAVGAARWIGCDAEAIRIGSSKRATVAALDARGIATPLSLAAAHNGRWIVKPDDGAGCSDTRVHAHFDAALADVRARERTGQSAALEPFVEGEAMSVSLLAGPEGAEAIAFNRQCIAIDANGRLEDLGVESHAFDPRHDPRAPRLHALAREIAAALPGLRGFVGFDFVWHPVRGPVVIEVNPRLTCAYVGLSAKLGRRLAAEVLALQGLGATSDATHA